MKTAILLATWNNLNQVAIVVVVVALVCALISLVAFLVLKSDLNCRLESFRKEAAESMPRAWRYFWRSILVAALALVIAVLPSSSNLWTTRIDLIKLELSSPENLAAGRERIDEIVRGLECKHLGQNCGERKP